jgi:3-hydroxybutyryl-CoA dehydrogenase
MALSRVAVVGAGFMGSGIAESVASAGIDVTVFEPEQAPLERSREWLHKSVDRAISRAKMSSNEAAGLVGRIVYSTQIGDVAMWTP